VLEAYRHPFAGAPESATTKKKASGRPQALNHIVMSGSAVQDLPLGPPWFFSPEIADCVGKVTKAWEVYTSVRMRNASVIAIVRLCYLKFAMKLQASTFSTQSAGSRHE
jgi:hypothetical protein